MEYIRQILASNLLRLRKSKGLTQVQIAEMIESTPASYNRWEKGVNWPDPESLEKIALALGVKSSEFFIDNSLSTPLNSSDFLKDSIIKELEAIIDKYKN
jgi:transcriptional regulator with XRE-family HTH domain